VDVRAHDSARDLAHRLRRGTDTGDGADNPSAGHPARPIHHTSAETQAFEVTYPNSFCFAREDLLAGSDHDFDDLLTRM
jgi:hypothetical protein